VLRGQQSILQFYVPINPMVLSETIKGIGLFHLTKSRKPNMNLQCMSRIEKHQLLHSSCLGLGLPNAVLSHIFTFLYPRQLTSLLCISKSWRNELLTQESFHSLWIRIVIGSDPIKVNYGNALSLNWLKLPCLYYVRHIIETLIISTGIAKGASVSELIPQDQLMIFSTYDFPKLRV